LGRDETQRRFAAATDDVADGLPLGESVILVQLLASPLTDLHTVAAHMKVSNDVLASRIADAVERGLVEREGSMVELTADGRQLAGRLVSAVRDCLLQMLGGWNPKDHPDLMDEVQRLSAEFAPIDVPVPAVTT
jgi:DNA-binding MarR family transcriptional regulator